MTITTSKTGVSNKKNVLLCYPCLTMFLIANNNSICLLPYLNITFFKIQNAPFVQCPIELTQYQSFHVKELLKPRSKLKTYNVNSYK